MKCEKVKVAQSCLTLCDSMDCNLPDPSVLGVSQARILEWVAISYSREIPNSRGYSQPRERTCVSCIAGRFFTVWATREAHWSLGPGEPLEKGMATHSSILAWKIPWTEKPGRLQSMESQRVGHDYDWTNNTTFLLFKAWKWVNFTQPKSLYWILLHSQHCMRYRRKENKHV